MHTLPPHGLEPLFHPSMRRPSQWQVVRYEVDLDPETGLISLITLSLRDAAGSIKRLRFATPRIDDFAPLRIPDASMLYVADMRPLGWQGEQSIEVGVWEEDRPVLFRAASVEEVDSN